MRAVIWLAKFVAMAGMVLVISTCITLLIINMVIEDAAKQFHLPLGQKIQFSWLAERIGEELNIVTSKDKKKESTEKNKAEASQKSSPVPTPAPTGPVPTPSAIPGDGGQNSAEKKPEEEEAITTMGRAKQSESKEAVHDQRVVITPDQLTEFKKKLSKQEKDKIFQLFASKVPEKEMHTISTLMEDGLTQDELDKVQEILLGYLKKEEVEEIIGTFKQGQ